MRGCVVQATGQAHVEWAYAAAWVCSPIPRRVGAPPYLAIPRRARKRRNASVAIHHASPIWASVMLHHADSTSAIAVSFLGGVSPPMMLCGCTTYISNTLTQILCYVWVACISGKCLTPVLFCGIITLCMGIWVG